MFGLIGGIFKFTTSFTTTFNTTRNTTQSTTTTFNTTQSTTTTFNTTQSTTTTFATSKSTTTTFSTSKNTTTTFSTTFNTAVPDNSGSCFSIWGPQGPRYYQQYCAAYYQYGCRTICWRAYWNGSQIRSGNYWCTQYNGYVPDIYNQLFPYTTGGYTYSCTSPNPNCASTSNLYVGQWNYVAYPICRTGSYNRSTSRNTTRSTTTTFNTTRSTTTTFNTTRSTTTTYNTTQSTTTTFSTSKSTTTTFSTTFATSRTTTRVTDFYS